MTRRTADSPPRPGIHVYQSQIAPPRRRSIPLPAPRLPDEPKPLTWRRALAEAGIIVTLFVVLMAIYVATPR